MSPKVQPAASEVEKLRKRTEALEARLVKLQTEVQEVADRMEKGESPAELSARLRRLAVPWRARWTPDVLIAKVQEWADLYGGPPSAADWNPSQARKEGDLEAVERFYSATWPNYHSSRYHFARWNDLIQAAGFEPVAPGMGTPGGGGPHYDGMPEWRGWEHLHGLRTRAGLSQIQLCEASNVSHGHLSRMERGQFVNPGVRIILALAHGLGVRPAALVE